MAADQTSEPAAHLRVFLTPPSQESSQEFVSALLSSESLHRPWVFPPRTLEEYEAYLGRIQSGRTIGFLIRCNSDHSLAGLVNISEPVMGVFCSAYLGFYAFAGHQRQGLMTEGLALGVDRAFGELGFHRLEANIQSANVNSAALVARLGFRKEGFSPGYLRIDGAWRDHDRWAILSDEWPSHRQRLFASMCSNGRQSQNV